MKNEGTDEMGRRDAFARLRMLRQRVRLRPEEKPALAQLTPTERRVLKLIAEGQTSREIAGHSTSASAPSNTAATTSPSSWNCTAATRC